MRFFAVAALCTALVLSGCASLFAEPSAGMAHLNGMQNHADARLENARFLGMAAVEGHIDIDGFKAMAKEELEEEGEDASFIDEFEFRFQNGALGDGRTGSWFGVFDEPGRDRFLIVQSVAGGLRSHLFDFEGDMGGDDAEWEAAGFAAFAPAITMLKARQSGSVESACDEDDFATSVPAGIDSDRAAQIAMDQPVFHNHTIDVPEGDYIYVYIPSYTYCWDDDVDVEPALWGVAHVDIDQLLFNETEPSFAYVIMNATNGDVWEADVEVPLMWNYEMFRITVTGELLFPPLGPPASDAHEFTVDEGVVSLWIYIQHQGGKLDHWFIDPSGDRVAAQAFTGGALLDLGDPEPGTWTLHSTFSHTPLESRSATVDITYISEA